MKQSTHGGAGAREIGARIESLEPRRLLAANVVAHTLVTATIPHRLILGFDSDVSQHFDASSFQFGFQDNQYADIQFSRRGTQVSISWPGVANFSPVGSLDDGRYTLTVHTADGSIKDFTASDMSVLRGEANGDGLVNSKDLSLLDRGFTRQFHGFQNGDFNWDGRIDAADYQVLADHYGWVTPVDAKTIADYQLIPSVPGALGPVEPPLPSDPTKPAPVGIILQLSTDGHVFHSVDFPSGLIDGKKYYYRARIYGRGQDTPWTAKKRVVTFLPAPSGLAVQEQADGTLLLNWSDNSNGESGFQILSSINGGPWTIVSTTAADQTSATLAAPPSGASVVYRVLAFTSDRMSAPTVPTQIKLLAPTNLSETQPPVDTHELQWSDNSHRASGYEIWRLDDTGFAGRFDLVATAPGNASSYSVAIQPGFGLSSFWIRAVFGTERSSFSNAVDDAVPPNSDATTYFDNDILPLDGSADLFAQAAGDSTYESTQLIVNDNFDENQHDSAGKALPDNQPNGLSDGVLPSDPDLHDAWIFVRQDSSATGTWQLRYGDSVAVWYESDDRWQRVSTDNPATITGSAVIPLKIEGIKTSRDFSDSPITLIWKIGPRTVIDKLGVTVFERKLATPTGLKVRINSRGLPALSWDAASDFSVAGFSVSQSLNGKTYEVEDSSLHDYTNNFLDANVPNSSQGKRVYYRVSATGYFNGSGESDPASTSIQIPFDRTPPVLPVTFTGTASQSGVTLTWSPSTSKDVAQYETYWRDKNGKYILRRTLDASFNDPFDLDEEAIGRGLDHYGLVAIDRRGNRSAMKIIAVRDQDRDRTPPAAPRNVTITSRGQGGYLIDWADNTESDFDHYLITRGAEGSEFETTDSILIDPDAPTVSDPIYFVYALDQQDNRSVPGTMDETPPAKPAGFRADSSNDGVHLRWKRPADNDLDHYLVTGDDGFYSGYLPPDQLSVVDDRTDQGFAIRYTLIAVDRSENWSSPQRLTVVAKIAPASDVHAESVGPNQVLLHWFVLGGDTTEIYRGTDPNFTPSPSTLIATQEIKVGDYEVYTDATQLSAGHSYYYKFVLKNALTTSDPTDPVRVDIPTSSSAPPVRTDTFVAVSFDPGIIRFIWNQTFDALSYRIEHFNTQTGKWNIVMTVAEDGTQSYEKESTAFDTAQRQLFRVRSINGWGISSPVEATWQPQ